MTKLRFLCLFAVILLLPFFSLGQFTRQQAKDLVLNQILSSDTGHIKVYSSLDTVPDTSKIICYCSVVITGKFIGLPSIASCIESSTLYPCFLIVEI